MAKQGKDRHPRLGEKVSPPIAVDIGTRTLAIDVGTTKVASIIGDADENEGVKILGVGGAPSRGLAKGLVANVNEAEDPRINE